MAATKKPWVDGPFELIPPSRIPYQKGLPIRPSHHMAAEMLQVHNVLLRGMNSIYLQATGVEKTASPGVVRDFVSYAGVWAQLVEEHHSTEETLVFPELEALLAAPGLMAGNVAQHRAFHAGLDAYDAYVRAVLAGTEAYDGVRFRAIIDGFMPALREHLSDEIDTLLRLQEHEDKADLAAWCADIVKRLGARVQDPEIKYTIAPFVLGTHDATWDKDKALGAWPPMPWFVPYLVRWLFAGKYRSWWQFAPNDLHSKPRDLPFAE